MDPAKEEKTRKMVKKYLKEDQGKTRFQALSLAFMDVSMDELFEFLKKMKEGGEITFGNESGPTGEVPIIPTPSLYIYNPH